MTESLTCSPGTRERQVRSPSGQLLDVPADWAVLPPGDAGLTRRVKAAGPSWTVVEKVGRKIFSRGVWAPAATIEAEKAKLEAERATPEWAKKHAKAVERRVEAQATYVKDFEAEVRIFLGFSSVFGSVETALARAVTAHATPVGSGTVARTKRIDIDRRAESAVIAWLRHQTTTYDSMRIARVKGARREVRRELAAKSRALLDRHRGTEPHAPANCPLCRALAA